VKMTVTLNVPEPTLSCVSLAVHVTPVVPTGKRLPEGGMHATGRSPSTRSSADAANVTTAPAGSSVSTLKSAGIVMTGGVVSRILTSKSRASCSAWNVATHWTIVRAIGNVEPDGGAQLTVALLPFQLALTSKVTTRPSGPVASSMTPFGIVHCHAGGSAAASGATRPATTRTRSSLRIIASAQRAPGTRDAASGA
jgi:hypothetical protein